MSISFMCPKPAIPRKAKAKRGTAKAKTGAKENHYRLSLGVKNLTSEILLRKWIKDKNPKHVKEAKEFFQKLFGSKKAPAITNPEFYLKLQLPLLSITPRERKSKAKNLLLKALPYEMRLLSDREHSEIQRKSYLMQVLEKFGKEGTLAKIKQTLEKTGKSKTCFAFIGARPACIYF